MGKSRVLFDLIHSLSPSEKRYFKGFCAGQSGEGRGENYLELFEILNGMENYDEGQIRAKLSNQRFAESLSAGKNYLYNLILKSLRNYHAGQLAAIRLQDMLADVVILERKGLIRQALKRVLQAEKLAAGLHLELDRLRILDLKRRIFRQFAPKKSKPLLEELHRETRDLMDWLGGDLKILDYYDLLFAGLQAVRGKTAAGHFAEAAQWLQENVQTENLSPRSSLAYHFIFASFHRLHQRYREAGGHYAQLVQLFEQHPFLKREYQQQYVGVISNYLIHCFSSRDFNRVPELMGKLKEVVPHNAAIARSIQEHLHYSRLLYCVFREDFAEAVPLLPEIEAFLAENRTHIPAERQLSYHFNIAWVYFMEGTRRLVEKGVFLPWYSKGLEKISFIINEPAFSMRHDIKVMIRVLAAIIHIELDNLSVADFFIRSAMHLTGKSGHKYLAEKITLRHLKQMTGLEKRERMAVMESLASQLEQEEKTNKLRIWTDRRR